MNKNRLTRTLTGALLALPLLFASCSKDSPRPREATDETKNLGHEVPAYAQLILQEATVYGGGNLTAETTLGNITLTGRADTALLVKGVTEIRALHHHEGEGHDHHHGDMSTGAFDVESIQAVPGRVYVLRINYLNADRKLMNDQLISPEQRDRHQHFFRQVVSRDKDRHPTYIDLRTVGDLAFNYTYQDEIDGQKNPVGLVGLIAFTKPGEYEVSIQLAHFLSRSKFVGNGREVAPFYTAAVRGAQSDINLPVFFHIDEEHDHDH